MTKEEFDALPKNLQEAGLASMSAKLEPSSDAQLAVIRIAVEGGLLPKVDSIDNVGAHYDLIKKMLRAAYRIDFNSRVNPHWYEPE